MVREIQAFFFRAASANQGVERLIDEGRLERGAERSPESSAQGTLDYFGFDVRIKARQMGAVYELLYCLENSARELVQTTLTETLGPDDWWDKGVPEKIRRSAEYRKRDDERARWHGPRGGSLLNYVDFGDLGDIILYRWQDFEDLLGDKHWVENYFNEMNRTRRALAHTGELSEHDVRWMEFRVLQWLRVVG